MKPKVMLIEACDFEAFPVGGQLSHAKHCIHALGERLALVGVSTDSTPTGVWTRKTLGGGSLYFFSIGRVDPGVKKPWLPRRLSAFLRLKYYREQILSLDVHAAFIQAPEVLLAVAGWGLRLCYSCPGVENPLTMSRYRFARLLATPFDRAFLGALAAHAELVLAAADREAIAALGARSRGALSGASIVHYPTRVDTSVFRATGEGRGSDPVFIACGRLNRVKGWDLILDAFQLVKGRLPSAVLYFVGDGEDRAELERRVAGAGLGDCVVITGFADQATVSSLLNRSRVFVLGSHREGWPTALIEALACGLPVVSTAVSGAGDLVIDGSNGFVVRSRDPELFAVSMIQALALPAPNPVSLAIARQYSLDNLRRDLETAWEPFRGAAT